MMDLLGYKKDLWGNRMVMLGYMKVKLVNIQVKMASNLDSSVSTVV